MGVEQSTLYYRLYDKDGGLLSKTANTNQTSNQALGPHIGRLDIGSIAPPYNVGSIKQHIAKVEELKGYVHMDLYLNPGDEAPVADSTHMKLNTGDQSRPGTQTKPIAIVVHHAEISKDPIDISGEWIIDEFVGTTRDQGAISFIMTNTDAFTGAGHVSRTRAGEKPESYAFDITDGTVDRNIRISWKSTSSSSKESWAVSATLSTNGQSISLVGTKERFVGDLRQSATPVKYVRRQQFDRDLLSGPM
ncbi:hypothetical protein M408DRAFT_110198 [Serendipita vermifera MAFF 305830]|uniref:Uncharacterized protein n=1 Tax=Serendipita vermifera MAFF 305830 TaxID=933852 RepID=A0A0C3A9C7_SERVB|nr:hypothetical protein M408DRAFT_110198 [Serendipita vermifera MAFF 305830]